MFQKFETDVIYESKFFTTIVQTLLSLTDGATHRLIGTGFNIFINVWKTT